jgi:hypothetical protein
LRSRPLANVRTNTSGGSNSAWSTFF